MVQLAARCDDKIFVPNFAIGSGEGINRELLGIHHITLFGAAGAHVSIHWHNSEHELGQGDIAAAKESLELWPPK